jgi:hypothetical protein
MFAALSITEYSAMAADEQCTSRAQRMQNHSPRMSAQAACGMWTTASAAASILLIQTGVVASVSLFVLLIILVSLLLVGLIGWLGLGSLVGLLSLSCLTGLVISLVGLVEGLVPRTKTGD